MELQGWDEPDSNWELDWRTGAASGVQRSCSWLLDLRTRRTGSEENTHKLRHNQAGWTKTEDKTERKVSHEFIDFNINPKNKS